MVLAIFSVNNDPESAWIESTLKDEVVAEQNRSIRWEMALILVNQLKKIFNLQLKTMQVRGSACEQTWKQH